MCIADVDQVNRRPSLYRSQSGASGTFRRLYTTDFRLAHYSNWPQTFVGKNCENMCNTFPYDTNLNFA